MSDDDIDLEPDELGRDLGEALIASLGPAILDGDGSILDPAEFAQPLYKSSSPLAPCQRSGRAQESDGRQLARLLPLRHHRPSSRAAEQRDEVAPSYLRGHSITSSAVCRNGSGMVRPSAFAVLRLMTSSNLVGCWTGRSLAFAPLRIRSTYPAACRN